MTVSLVKRPKKKSERDRIARVLDNLRTHHYDLRIVNIRPISQPYEDLLSDDGVRVSYGDCRDYESGYRVMSWDMAADMLADAPDDEWNTPAVMLPYASYSDYSGSYYERSNADVLLSDAQRRYAGTDDEYRRNYLRPHLREVYGDYGTRAVLLPLAFLTSRRYSGPWVVELYSTLDALADYPSLDDEHASELETELIGEAIRDYGCFDIGRAAAELLSDDAAEALSDALSDTDDERFARWLGDYIMSGDSYPSCEDAVGSVAWNGIDDSAARVIADYWVAQGSLPWDDDISTAIRYDERTDSMTDAASVGRWSDARHAELTAQGMDSSAAWTQVYAELSAIEPS